MANTTEFPDCCGLIILNKFRGGHPGADEDDCLSEEKTDEFLEKNEKEYFNQRAGLIAVLSEPQNERIGHVFLKRKWELTLNGIMNPRTGTKIYMYYRNLNYTRAREKRIFG